MRCKRYTRVLVAMLLGCPIVAYTITNMLAGSLSTDHQRPHSMGGRQLHMAIKSGAVERNDLLLQLQLAKPPSNAEVSSSYVIVETFNTPTVRQSLSDLLLLQCWAGGREMKVVTPWVLNSAMATPLTNWLSSGTRLPLEDFYDVNKWNERAIERKASEMVDISDFFSLGPRSVVVIDFSARCPSTTTANSSWAEYTQLKGKGFAITRVMCIATSTLTASALLNKLSTIYNLLPHPTTLLLRGWGVRSVNKLPHGHSCGQYVRDLTIAQPSKKVLADASRYIDSYLSSRSYTSVVVSAEATRAKNFPACLERTLTFLHVIIGRNKSTPFLTVQGRGVDRLLNFQRFFQAVYHRTLTLSHWRQQIEAASSINEPEYRGLVEQVVSWKAPCVIQAGGGTHQQYIAQHYRRNIAKRRERNCLASIRQCFV